MGDVAAVKISAIDGAIIRFEAAHVGPVDVTSLDIHNDAVRKFSAFAHNGLQIGTVGVRGKNAAGCRVQERTDDPR